MKRIENNCVSCPTDLGCLGQGCPFLNVVVHICDTCQNEEAKYKIDDEEFCENCANEYLQELFDSLTVEEKAKAVDAVFRRIECWED